MSCAHGMPTPGSCVDCMNEGLLPPPPQPEQPQVLGGAFPARYPGFCRGCDLPIAEGQDIIRLTDLSYRHARGCAP